MQKTPTRNIRVESMQPLDPPSEFLNRLPVNPTVEQTVLDGRYQLQQVIRGQDERLVVIVGPCSIHDENAALEYAEKLYDLSVKLDDRLLIAMRVYFEKPRTTVGWKGLVYDPNLDDTFNISDGLNRARKLLLKIGSIGLYACTEFLDPIVPQYIADLISWAAIGARTTESQTHRQMASGLSMPVGFKNATDGSTQVAVDAIVSSMSSHGFLGIGENGQACMVRTTGNPYSHMVLRGGRNGPNYDKKSIDEALKQLDESGVRSNLIVDCSHGNSNKDHERQSVVFRDVVRQRIEGQKGIFGCMLESNLFPGSQNLSSDPTSLKYGVSITDACVGWEETEKLLRWAYNEL